MTVKKLAKYCLSKPHSVLEYPFGTDPAVYKVGGKIFAMIHQRGGSLKVSMKSDLMLADLLRQQYAAITPMCKSAQWNDIICDGTVPDEEIFNQIDHSHEIVFNSLTKKKRAQLIHESHPLYLFPDPSYEPHELNEGDEYFRNGIFIFNITRLLEHIAANRGDYSLSTIRVADYATGFGKLEPEQCANADLQYPLLLAEISPGRYNVIDGAHRLYKAFFDEVETLDAYLIPPKLHSLFITEQKAYDTYLEYWNEKLKYQ